MSLSCSLRYYSGVWCYAFRPLWFLTAPLLVWTKPVTWYRSQSRSRVQTRPQDKRTAVDVCTHPALCVWNLTTLTNCRKPVMSHKWEVSSDVLSYINFLTVRFKHSSIIMMIIMIIFWQNSHKTPLKNQVFCCWAFGKSHLNSKHEGNHESSSCKIYFWKTSLAWCKLQKLIIEGDSLCSLNRHFTWTELFISSSKISVLCILQDCVQVCFNQFKLWLHCIYIRLVHFHGLFSSFERALTGDKLDSVACSVKTKELKNSIICLSFLINQAMLKNAKKRSWLHKKLFFMVYVYKLINKQSLVDILSAQAACLCWFILHLYDNVRIQELFLIVE